MLTITDLTVRSFDKDCLNLSWRILETTLDPFDYTFIIERSESSFGPWDIISKPFSDKYFFRDITAKQYDKNRQYWYRIKVSEKNTDNNTYSGLARLEANPDLIANEVRRLEFILFREHIGRKCWLYPVRTFGQKCVSCYDTRTGQRLRANCPTCYDTTFIRGYLDPIEIYVQFDPNSKTVELSTLGELQIQNTNARSPYFPPLKPRDLIIESENRRWRVVNVTTTARLRAPLHQEFAVHEIPPSDIEYMLPINIENAQTFQASPQREFHNAQDLNNRLDSEWLTRTLKSYGF